MKTMTRRDLLKKATHNFMIFIKKMLNKELKVHKKMQRNL